MRARGWISLFALAACLSASAAWAQGGAKRFVLTPFVGWTMYDDQLPYSTGQKIQDELYYGGRLSLRTFSVVWLEAAGGYTRIQPQVSGDNINRYHVSGNIVVSPAAPLPFSPFLSLGGGYLREDHELGTKVESGTFEIAGGLRIRFTDRVGLRIEGRDILRVPKENWGTSDKADVMVGGGLEFGFGGRGGDADGDGVSDKSDRCPDTPNGCQADATGCTTDADHDGICDGIDKCSSTPGGAKVNGQGCPGDADSDGAWDGLDQCADTPAGAKVDANGCPSDTDRDGVYDGLDHCADTPKGCKPDASGCPTDTDGDGVCDGIDQCPDTKPGLKIDKDGCPIEVVERETQMLETGLIRIEDIHFETGRADIMPESEPALQVVGEVLSKWPELRIEVGGHSDSRGAAAYNQRLSDERAASVREYLLRNFPKLSPQQLTSEGYGESRPVVSNTTQLNMAKNRRVEIKVLNREQLKREIERRKMIQR